MVLVKVMQIYPAYASKVPKTNLLQDPIAQLCLITEEYIPIKENPVQSKI